MPGITSAEIQRINGNANYSIHSDIKIIDYINNYIRNGRIEFPRWQRDDTWPKHYRPTLIESIMGRSDLPKLYLSKNPNGTFYILDGGHRTRAIFGFMDNTYPITIDGDKVYYNETPSQNTRNTRVMTDYEKNVFDNYLLTITIYETYVHLHTISRTWIPIKVFIELIHFTHFRPNIICNLRIN